MMERNEMISQLKVLLVVPMVLLPMVAGSVADAELQRNDAVSVQTKPASSIGKTELVSMREKAKQRTRRIIWNNDGNEILIYWHDTVEQFLSKRIEAALATGSQVDSIFYCTGVTTKYSHDTNVAERMPDYNRETAHNMQMLRNLGLDQLSATVERGHKAGVEVFWSHRMNDIHDAIDTKELFSQWKSNHPECVMGTIADKEKYPQTSPKFWWSTLDYEKPAVTAYVLDITEEVCQNYDVDGIELDYYRYPMLFRPNLEFEPATQAQVDIMTEFQRSIYRMAEREGEKRGRPILIAARVPGSVAACRYSGIGIEQWLKEGLVDIIIVGNGEAWPNTPVKALVELAHAHNVPAYPCLKFNGYPKPDRDAPETWRAAASNALSTGADGVYLFNYGQIPNEPPPGFKELGDPVKLAKLDKDFYATVPHTRGYLYKASVFHPKHLPASRAVPSLLPNRGFIGNTGDGWDTSGAVTATAINYHNAFPPTMLTTVPGIDADGLRLTPSCWNEGTASGWVTNSILPSTTPQRGGTVVGGPWVEFAFDQPYPVNKMWIWNLNEHPSIADMSMKTVTIQYSLTGSTTSPAEWTTIFSGDLTKSEVDGDTSSYGVSDKIDFGGAMAKYVVITAAAENDHNYWYANRGETHNDAGLGAVRFYHGKVDFVDSAEVTLMIGDDIAAAAIGKTLDSAIMKVKLSNPKSLDFVSMSLNGNPLTPTARDTVDGWVTLSTNPSWYRVGDNNVSLVLAQGAMPSRVQVEAVEVYVKYKR